MTDCRWAMAKGKWSIDDSQGEGFRRKCLLEKGLKSGLPTVWI
jgi:hypothetical protein